MKHSNLISNTWKNNKHTASMKTFAAIITFCSVANTSFAQGQVKNTGDDFKRHEISIGAGFGYDVVEAITLVTLINNVISGEFSQNTNAARRGGYHLSYTYHINKRFGAGGTIFYKESYESNSSVDYNQWMYGIAAEGRYNYISSKYFRLYALAGVGLYNAKQELKHKTDGNTNDFDKSQIEFTYQISPLCFEVGKTFGAKVEMGYGYRGLGNFSVFYKF